MSAKFMAYEYVPSGFETILVKKEFPGRHEVHSGGLWNLWWNIKLTDDPESWDSEIKSINKMQEKLGELTVDQRLIRAHIAEFCRRHPLFPQSIGILCKEIGNGRFSKPIVKIGCEGRSLLDSLGYHDSQSLNNQRKGIFKEYAQALKKWLLQDQPENLRQSKVFGFLGEPTNSKEAFAKKLVSLIDSDGELSISSLKQHCGDACKKTSVLESNWIPFPFRCLKCQEGCPEGVSIPDCQCCDSMVIDAGLLCAGWFGEKKQMAGEFRRFIEENILVYATAVNSWLKKVPLKHVSTLLTLRYTAKDNALEIAERIHSSLGKKDEAKEWLAACLLKTIKDNKKEYPEDGVKRTELIDGFPDTTSWLREECVI